MAGNIVGAGNAQVVRHTTPTTPQQPNWTDQLTASSAAIGAGGVVMKSVSDYNKNHNHKCTVQLNSTIAVNQALKNDDITSGQAQHFLQKQGVSQNIIDLSLKTYGTPQQQVESTTMVKTETTSTGTGVTSSVLQGGAIGPNSSSNSIGKALFACISLRNSRQITKAVIPQNEPQCISIVGEPVIPIKQEFRPNPLGFGLLAAVTTYIGVLKLLQWRRGNHPNNLFENKLNSKINSGKDNYFPEIYANPVNRMEKDINFLLKSNKNQIQTLEKIQNSNSKILEIVKKLEKNS